MLPKLKSLAVFAKVAETGSFSAAANVLGISAPVVSQHISQLEKTLDTALIYRSTRSLTLTEAGQRLSIHAQNMLDAAETGLEELQNVMNSPRGKLSVSMPTFMASPKFTKLLAAFCDAYPDVIMEITYETGHHNLNESGYDLAIQVGDLSDSNFMVKKLTEGHACLFASPDLVERFGRADVPQDIFDKGYPLSVKRVGPIWICIKPMAVAKNTMPAAIASSGAIMVKQKNRWHYWDAGQRCCLKCTWNKNF